MITKAIQTDLVLEVNKAGTALPSLRVLALANRVGSGAPDT
jgi:hypothetical protein